MPKNTAQRRIDSRRQNRATTISGVTLSAPAGITDHGALSGLADDDHSQYLLVDGTRSLAGNLAVAAGITIDGVDLSAHAADPAAHHALATAGNSGISVAGQAISLAAAAAGAGLGYAAGVLSVNVAGLGLSVASDAVTLTSSSNPGAAAAILASDASGYLNLVRMVLSDRLRTPLIDTASGDLTLSPAEDIMLSPASNLVKLTSGTMLQSDNYASQATGMRVTYAGEADFRYLFVDEMHAKSFIADLEQALAGGQIISKSVAMVAEAFTLPAAGGAVTVRFRDLPSAPNMAVFQSGDWVAFRSFTRSGGSLTIGWAWGQVTSYADGTGGNEGTQTWTWTRNAGTPGAATGTIAADALALDFGVSGNGFYEVNAIDGAYAQNSPYWRIVTWSSHPATQTVRVQGGNLRGLFGVADEYGFFAGDGVTTSSKYLRLSNVTNEYKNLTASWYKSSALSVQVTPDRGIDLLAGAGAGFEVPSGLTWYASLPNTTFLAGVLYDNATDGAMSIYSSAYSKNATLQLTAYRNAASGYRPGISMTHSATTGAIQFQGDAFEFYRSGGTPSLQVNAGGTPYTIWHSGNDGASSGLDADLFHTLTLSTNGNLWGAVPYVGADGVMEVGKYIDFHESDADTSDFNVRLTSTSNVLHTSGALTTGGQLTVNSGPGVFSYSGGYSIQATAGSGLYLSGTAGNIYRPGGNMTLYVDGAYAFHFFDSSDGSNAYVRIGTATDMYNARLQVNGNIHSNAVITAESYMQLKSGSAPSGASGWARIWFDGTNLRLTTGAGTYTINKS